MDWKRILTFLNLLDDAGDLSLTNLALVALVVKMLCSRDLDWPSTVTLMIAFANYMHKRHVSNDISESESKEEMVKIRAQYEKAVVAQAEVIKDISVKIQGVSSAFNLSNLVKK